MTAALGLATPFTAIRTYAVNAPRYAIYGALSGIIILLTSLYFAAFVLMIGFIVNAVALARDTTLP
jgi:membrane protein